MRSSATRFSRRLARWSSLSGANPLADWTGWHFPVAFIAAGVALALVAVLLYWMVTRAEINLALARLVMLLNVMFALVGLLALLVLWPSLTEGGRWLIGLLALFVGSSGAMEFAGLRGGR